MLRLPQRPDRVVGELRFLPEEFQSAIDLGMYGIFRVAGENCGVIDAVCTELPVRPVRFAGVACPVGPGGLPAKMPRVINPLRMTIHEGMVYYDGEFIGGMEEVTVSIINKRHFPIAHIPQYAVDELKAKILGLGMVVGPTGEMRLGKRGGPT